MSFSASSATVTMMDCNFFGKAFTQKEFLYKEM
jgi:hypothetical protein